MTHVPPSETVFCRECGQPMEYLWSQGTWDEGCWVIVCRNVARGGLIPAPRCLMAGEPFAPDGYTPAHFARRRALHVVRHAGAGIVYRHPDGTAEQWIAEAVARGILPADWATAFQGAEKAG